MECPSCGANVEEGRWVCPHCQTPLPTAETQNKESKGCLKGCLACGCGCLVLILIVLAAITYAGWRLWNVVENQLESEPLEIVQVQFTEEQQQQLREKFDPIKQAFDQNEEKSFSLTLSDKELTYVIQEFIAQDEGMKQRLLMQVKIEDNNLVGTFSFKIDENRYFNGKCGVFINIQNQKIDMKLKAFTFGTYTIEKEHIDQINSGISQQNIQEGLDSLNQSPREEFPLIIDAFRIVDDTVEITFTTKGS